MEDLTEEEKKAVLSAIRRKINTNEVAFMYATYILPSLLFTIYAIFKKDYIAALVAYGALLIPAIWYLSYSFGSSKHLYSAIEKYENCMKATKIKIK
jgi:hypothetical protein